MRSTIYIGDCIEVMRKMPANSVDSIVTDPPYGTRFMGKAWDGADIEERHQNRHAMASHDAPDGHGSVAAEAGQYDLTPPAMRAFQNFSEAWAREAFRVLKPGGHLIAFAAARTYHRMACGVEDAGFEVRDMNIWIYGSGFPKSHNLHDEFEGWGTALKPAHEPGVFARKPLIGTVAENMKTFGVGAIHIDACRIETDDELRAESGAIPCRQDEAVPRTRAGEDSAERTYADRGATDFAATPGPRGGDARGRWPANVMTDGSDVVIDAFPDAPGQQGRASDDGASSGNAVYGALRNVRTNPEARNDSGSAARFFYCAKASRVDRNEGCEHLTQASTGMVSNTSGQHITRRDEGYLPRPQGNTHPTVKPTPLMRWLLRLVTPPGGTTLDPFCGSGSSGKAAALEGFNYIGIDDNSQPGSTDIAEARIAHAEQQHDDATRQGVLYLKVSTVVA